MAETKATPKTTELIGDVVLETGAFDVTKPELLQKAEELFRANIAETHEKATVTAVKLIKVNHHVGTAATYRFSATLTA